MRSAWTLLLAGCGVASSALPMRDGDRSPVRVVQIPRTNVKSDFVPVPGGKVGDVEVKPFWIGTHEVAWREFMPYYKTCDDKRVDGFTGPSPLLSRTGQIPTFPNDLVADPYPLCFARWHAGVGFAEWLSRKTGRVFRLPTEPEWELAAKSAFPEGGLDAMAWHLSNTPNKKPQPVGKKKPNALGVYDILGNVWEFCLEQDQPPNYGPVLRGGGWHTPPDQLTPAARTLIKLPEWDNDNPQDPKSMWFLSSVNFTGFRLVMIDDAVSAEAREAYRPKVKVQILQKEEGDAKFMLTRVKGRITNQGNQTLVEAAVLVYFIDSGGKPVFRDSKGRPSCTIEWPVLQNSRFEALRKPMRPGESREFTVDVPEAVEFGETLERVGAEATGLVFARP